MRLDRLFIPAGNTTLAALAYSPSGDSKPLSCVLSHGFTSSKATMDLLAAYLAGRGYGCLTFDCRGHKLGGSTGELNSMAQAVEDLRVVVAAARERFAQHDCVLIGHSMGALTSMAVAVEDPQIVGLVAIATGARPSKGFSSAAGKAMIEQRFVYVDGAPSMTLLTEMDALSDNVERLGDRPSLFVAAKNDLLVRPDTLKSMSLLAGPKSQFIEVEAQHLDAPDRCRGAVASWLDQTFNDSD
jgi:pimeloyl-ACP methyl ester carboxylesterase